MFFMFNKVQKRRGRNCRIFIKQWTSDKRHRMPWRRTWEKKLLRWIVNLSVRTPDPVGSYTCYSSILILRRISAWLSLNIKLWRKVTFIYAFHYNTHVNRHFNISTYKYMFTLHDIVIEKTSILVQFHFIEV